MADLPSDAKFRKFKDLSAYLDGELGARECQRVREWLNRDPQARSLYYQLLRLRQGIQTMPVPTAPISQVRGRVFQRLRSRHHWRWGGGAVAALVLVSFSTWLGVSRPGTNHAALQVATNASSATGLGLWITLERPVVDLPTVPNSGKTPKVVPRK